jgi:hypothetical protein
MLRGEKAGDVEHRRQIPKRKSPASTKPARAPEPSNRMLGQKCAQGRYSSDVRDLSPSDPQPPNDVQRIKKELAPFRGKNETGGRTIEGQIELEWPNRSERAFRAQIASDDPRRQTLGEVLDPCGKRPRRWSMDRGREAERRLAVPRSPRRPRSRRPLTRLPELQRRKDLLVPRSRARSARIPSPSRSRRLSKDPTAPLGLAEPLERARRERSRRRRLRGGRREPRRYPPRRERPACPP